MKIKDAKKPCKMGTWAPWAGRAPWPRPEAPWQGGLVPNPSLVAGALQGWRVEGPFQPGVRGALPTPLYLCDQRLQPPGPFTSSSRSGRC